MIKEDAIGQSYDKIDRDLSLVYSSAPSGPNGKLSTGGRIDRQIACDASSSDESNEGN